MIININMSKKRTNSIIKNDEDIDLQRALLEFYAELKYGKTIPLKEYIEKTEGISDDVSEEIINEDSVELEKGKMDGLHKNEIDKKGYEEWSVKIRSEIIGDASDIVIPSYWIPAEIIKKSSISYKIR